MSWPRREGQCLRSEHCNIGPRGYLPAVLHKQSSNQSIQILSLPSNSLSQCLDGNYKISLMIFSLPEMCNCRSVQLSRDGRLTVTCILRFYSLWSCWTTECGSRTIFGCKHLNFFHLKSRDKVSMGLISLHLYLQPIFLRDYRTQLYLCDIFNHVKHAVFLGLHYIRALI